MRWLLAVALLGGCDLGWGSDPYEGVPRHVCDPGHAAEDGGCVAPIADVTIDGEVDDWSAVEAIAIDVACLDAPCPALPDELRIARVPPANDYSAGGLLLALGGAAPPADPDTRWVLRFTEAPELAVSSGIDELVIGGGTSAWKKNGYAVTYMTDSIALMPAWLALPTTDGMETAIAGDWLPFPGAARLTITVERDDAAVASSDEIPICWMGVPIWNPDPCGAPRQ